MSSLLRKRGYSSKRNRRTSVFDPAYDDVRLFKVIGIQQNDSWAGTATQMDDEYNKYMKPAYHGDGSVYFGVRSIARWNSCIKNDPTNGGDGTVIPSLTDMRNAAWSGYTWNDALGNPTGTHTLDTMRNATCVAQGKAKVLIQLSVSATSGTPFPDFLKRNAVEELNASGVSVLHSVWGWRGNDVGGDGIGDWRVKFWVTEARQYAANFVLAAIDRFVSTNTGGNNIGSVKLGEYFQGPAANRPADYPGNDGYNNGYWEFLKLIADGMSSAADNKRVWIHQSNPQLTAVRPDHGHIIPLKMGISASDPHFWGPSPGNNMGTHSQEFFNRNNYHGIIPMAAPGDSPNYVQLTRGETVWQVPPNNPFGIVNGALVDVEPIHGAWWYGHHGVVRMDQEMIYGVGGVNRIVAPETTRNQFHVAMDALGPGGIWHGKDNWGGVPHLE